MMLALYSICYLLIGIGFSFAITAVIGLIKTDNIYKMLHIASINDMLGVPLMLLGLMCYAFLGGQREIGTKIGFLIVLIYIIAPIASYVFIKIIYFIKKYSV